MGIRTLSAAALLALGSGCMTADSTKIAAAPKKPDVTQPGVLPPPQEVLRASSGGPDIGTVTQAGGMLPPGPGTAPVQPAAAGASPISKMLSRPEKKMIATDFAIAWQPRIGYLPDPTRNGVMGTGLVGQMLLFGGNKLEFAQADGVLTVDLIDETPRPPGQPAATPERWQIDKNTLRNLKTMDETFGWSYVLFLPWPAYRPDITKVKISARYDPEVGHTLFAAPTTVTIDTSAPVGAPVWDEIARTSGPRPPAQPFRNAPVPVVPTPAPGAGAPLAPGPLPPTLAPTPIPIGGRSVNNEPPVPPAMGAGGAPVALPPGLDPIAITIGGRK